VAVCSHSCWPRWARWRCPRHPSGARAIPTPSFPPSAASLPADAPPPPPADLLRPHRAHRVSSPCQPEGLAHIWETLHRFGMGLQACERIVSDIHPAVRMIHQLLEADVCFWYSAATGRVGPVVGRCAAAPRNCLALARQLLSRQRGGCDEVLWSRSADAQDDRALAPQSALMVRVGKSQSWIVVVSCDATRKLQQADISLVRLTKRILLEYHT